MRFAFSEANSRVRYEARWPRNKSALVFIFSGIEYSRYELFLFDSAGWLPTASEGGSAFGVIVSVNLLKAAEALTWPWCAAA